VKKPIQIYCDSDSARRTVKSWKTSQRSKHLDVRCHFGREQYDLNEMVPGEVRSEDNYADLATKPPTKLFLMRFRERVMMKVKDA